MGCFCFCSQRLSAAAWTRGPFRTSRQGKHPQLPLLSVFSHVFDVCFPSFLPNSPGSFQPQVRPQQRFNVQHLSLWAVWVYKEAPAGMPVHECACHIWHPTPAHSVCLCQPGTTIHLKYSGGCRKALINTAALQPPVLCIYEAEPSRFGQMTDLLTSSWCS